MDPKGTLGTRAPFWVLGGFSLQLNHLIASRTTNYDWPFGTLSFGLMAQIWTQGTLRDILGPILVIFEICQFLTIPGPFEYFSENGWSQNIKVFSIKEWLLPPYRFSFRSRGPWAKSWANLFPNPEH